ncbi:glycosyltransferase family 4 protein [Streptomyces sp. NPDC056672]|uniref:glycosyltransferase family 4 protein n=1 Tax=Streptomyces sp. NPDC056672 TaxID=3345906 RepID=UPI0036CC540F
MRILHIAGPFVTIPPRDYGGSERVVSTLESAQVRLGHQVTTFSVGTSRPSGALEWFYPDVTSGWHWADEVVQTAKALAISENFDIVHNHTALGTSLMHLSRSPAVTTLHNFADQKGRIDAITKSFPDTDYVAISENQRRMAHALNVRGVIHNAIPDDMMEASPRVDEGGDFLLFIGRMAAVKGVHTAIEVARAARIPLVIAGPVPERDREYFEKTVEPHVDGKEVTYVGPVAGPDKEELYRKALGVLMPIAWEEPFGLVAVEAQAMGTPVLCFDRGALPELVRHEVTGLISTSVEEMVLHVGQLGHLDRRECSRWARRRFSPEYMARQYLELYETIVRSSGTGSRAMT